MNIEAAKSMVEEVGDCLDETQRAYSKQSYNLADVFVEQLTRISQELVYFSREVKVFSIYSMLRKDNESQRTKNPINKLYSNFAFSAVKISAFICVHLRLNKLIFRQLALHNINRGLL